MSGFYISLFVELKQCRVFMFGITGCVNHTVQKLYLGIIRWASREAWDCARLALNRTHAPHPSQWCDCVSGLHDPDIRGRMVTKHCTQSDGRDSQLPRSSELYPSWVAWIKSDRVALTDSSPEILAGAFYIEELLLRFHLLLGKITIQAVWDCSNGQIGLSRRRGGRKRGGNMSCPAQETHLGSSNPDTQPSNLKW